MADEPTQTSEAPESGAEPQSPSVPPEVMERLDQIGSKLEQFEPLLQGEPEPLGIPEQADPYAQTGDGFTPQQPGMPPQYADPYAQENVQWVQDPQTGQPVPVPVEPYGQPDPYGQYQQPQGPDPKSLVEQAVSPIQQRLDQLERERQDQRLDAIVNEFPDLQDEQKRSEFAQHVAGLAAEAVQGLPQSAAEQQWELLVTNPTFVRNAYLAKSAGERAAQGAPAGDQGAVLEGGSGANPAPASEEVPVQQRILTAGGSGANVI